MLVVLAEISGGCLKLKYKRVKHIVLYGGFIEKNK